MKQNKKILFFAIAFIMIFISQSANAFIVLDPTKGVGKIYKNISEYAKQVQEDITALQDQILGKKWVQDGISAAKYAKATHDANAKVFRQYQRIYNNAMNSDAVFLAQKTSELASISRKIKELEKQKQEVLNSYQEIQSAQDLLIDGKIKTLENNNIIYQDQDLEDAKNIIEKNNEAINVLKAQKEVDAAKNQTDINTTISVLDNEIKNLESAKTGIENEIKGLTQYLISDFINDVEVLTKSKDLNFVSANKELTSDEIERIKRHREDERDAVSNEIFSKVAGLKSVLSSKDASTSSFADLNNSFEEISSNILSLTEIKVAQTEDLIVFIELMILDMKLQTAQDLALMTSYQFDDTDKNLEIFDLKDYVFDYKEYQEEQLKNQPMSINTIYRNLNRVNNAKNNVVDDFSGGLVEDAERFLDRAIDPNNAGMYRDNNNELEKLQRDINSTENNLERTIENSMDLFDK